MIRFEDDWLAKIETDGKSTEWNLSPDGDKIASVRDDSDSVQLLDLRSKQVRVIHPTLTESDLYEPAWSVDGQRLFLTAQDNQGSPRLMQMDLAGHTRLLLQNAYGWIGEPTPSPDGRHLAYVTVVNETNVTLLEHF